MYEKQCSVILQYVYKLGNNNYICEYNIKILNNIISLLKLLFGMYLRSEGEHIGQKIIQDEFTISVSFIFASNSKFQLQRSKEKRKK